jgi:hypothetical protein
MTSVYSSKLPSFLKKNLDGFYCWVRIESDIQFSSLSIFKPVPLGHIFQLILWFSSATFILPNLHNLHLPVSLTKRTNRRSFLTFQTAIFFRISKNIKEKSKNKCAYAIATFCDCVRFCICVPVCVGGGGRGRACVGVRQFGSETN